MTEAAGRVGIVDLRSDTVTHPTAAMRRAMERAPLGDDVFGDDPTVKALEARLATLVGLEDAVFFPTGTQSNLAALMAHCGRGEEFICGERAHVFAAEALGSAVLGSIAPCPLPMTPNGQFSLEAVEAAIKPDDPHCPVTRLICLENTFNGRLVPLDHQVEVVSLAGRYGLSTHLDGARLFNAALGLGVEPGDVARGFDSVSICLSKGMGTPAGTVLCGKGDLIRRARRIRKMLGGGMRQVGILAACGLAALEDWRERLAEDHRRARLLADGLAGLPGFTIDPGSVETNMVFLTGETSFLKALTEHLAATEILVAGSPGRLRLVTHHDVDDEGIERVVAAFRSFDGRERAA